MLDAALKTQLQGYLELLHRPYTGAGLLAMAAVMSGGSGERLGVVESCTGGLLGAAITDTPGSSSVFVGGLLTLPVGLPANIAPSHKRSLVFWSKQSTEKAFRQEA